MARRAFGLIAVFMLVASFMGTATPAKAATTIDPDPIKVQGETLCVWTKSGSLDVCVELFGEATIDMALETKDPSAFLYIGPYCTHDCPIGYAVEMEMEGGGVLDLLVTYQHCCGQKPMKLIDEHMHIGSDHNDNMVKETLYICVVPSKK